MSLGSLLLVVPVFIMVCCGLGILWCQEIMLGDLAGRLGEGEEMRFPHASWNTFEIYRLHKKYYPNSRIRSTWRFLLCVGLASFGTIILVMFYAAFSKPIAPPRIDGG